MPFFFAACGRAIPALRKGRNRELSGKLNNDSKLSDREKARLNLVAAWLTGNRILPTDASSSTRSQGDTTTRRTSTETPAERQHLDASSPTPLRSWKLPAVKRLASHVSGVSCPTAAVRIQTTRRTVRAIMLSCAGENTWSACKRQGNGAALKLQGKWCDFSVTMSFATMLVLDFLRLTGKIQVATLRSKNV